MDPQQRLQQVEGRLVDAGYAVTAVAAVGGRPTLMGHTSQFRWRWLATRVHLLVYARAVDTVTVDRLERFTRVCLDHGIANKGALIGLQVGVAVAPVLIGSRVDDGARRYAEHQIERQYAAFAWPVAIDAPTGEAFRHTGRPALGAVYTSWMRQQIDAATVGR